MIFVFTSNIHVYMYIYLCGSLVLSSLKIQEQAISQNLKSGHGINVVSSLLKLKNLKGNKNHFFYKRLSTCRTHAHLTWLKARMRTSPHPARQDSHLERNEIQFVWLPTHIC